MNAVLNKLLKISENYSYIYPVLSNSVISHHNYGPFGELLRNNIFNEWIFSNVLNKDGNVFPYFSRGNTNKNFIKGIEKHYMESKKICNSQLPFTIVYAKVPSCQEMTVEISEDGKYFRPRDILQLKSITFTPPEDGRRFFNYWLRQRKMWWRKFSANPGRFTITEINTEKKNEEFSHIQASFPWGVQDIETVRCFSDGIYNEIDSSELVHWKINRGKKSILPCIVESVTNLEMATMCFLCDSYSVDVRLDTELPHEVMKFHRKLAPYKVAVVFNQTQKNEDLLRLGEFLTLNLKKVGIASLYLVDNDTKSLEDKFKFYDLLGVPYVVVLHESTLSDGIFGLRCRETTLQEKLHISNLTNYMEKLLKNY